MHIGKVRAFGSARYVPADGGLDAVTVELVAAVAGMPFPEPEALNCTVPLLPAVLVMVSCSWCRRSEVMSSTTKIGL